jgi:hypothetical protein
MKNLQTFEEFLNEATASKDAMEAFNSVMELDSPDMETFFEMLTDYFKRNQEALSNMDAKKITAHLQSVHELIKKRTGN